MENRLYGARLSKAERCIVEQSILEVLANGKYHHPDYIDRICYRLRITKRQLIYALQKMVKEGTLEQRYHARGWYAWYSYRISPNKAEGGK